MTTTIEAADLFFTRRRTRAELTRILLEHTDNRLQLAAAEAHAYKYDRLRRERAARNKAATEAAAAVPRATGRARTGVSTIKVDRRALAELPRTALHRSTPVEALRARQAADGFWRRIDNASARFQNRVAAEAFTEDDRIRAERLARWQNAPIDPISLDEYHTIALRSARSYRRRHRTYRRGDIRPAGMTLARAYEIAHAALDAIDNGTAPTHR